MPYYPSGKKDKFDHGYVSTTYFDKLVADYANITIMDVLELDHIDYLVYRRDAFISGMNKTEAGREYLFNAWRLEQTAPDTKALRDAFGQDS